MAKKVQKLVSTSNMLQGSRNPLIDLLRIFCALSVVLFHYQIGSRDNDAWQSFTFGTFVPTWTTNSLIQTWTKFGYLGVDIFFFLSGLVIIKTIASRLPSEFLLARFKRLFVPYFIVLIPTAAIYFFFSPKPIGLENILWDLTFSAQWKGVSPVIAATWTLAVEVVFYFIIAGLIFLQKIFKEININVSMFSFLLSWLFLNWISQTNTFPIPFNLLHLSGYSNLFIAGGISYFIFMERIKINVIFKCFLIILVYSTIWIHFFNRMGRENNTLWFSLFVVTGLILAVFYSGQNHNYSKAYLSISSIMGTATYTFYLLHQQLGLFFSTLIHAKLGWPLMYSAVFTLILLFSFSIWVESLNKKIWKLWPREVSQKLILDD